ncbi:MAG: hypothetical protein ACRDT0_11255 [Pseudonocardiaceae bacterium]
MQPTLNQQQGTERMEQHIMNAVAVIEPKPSLELQSANTQDCSQPSDDGPLGRVVLSVAYWLREIPVERNPEVFAATKRHWMGSEWTVLSDRSQRAEAPFISVQNDRDGFRMSIQSSVDGQLSLGASSPCIWPNGTPEPEGP